MKEFEKELENIIKTKDDIVDKLVNKMLTTKDEELRNKIGFVLVDHFKSEKIEEAIIKVFNEKRWSDRRGTVLYLLSEYTNSPTYLYFLIDLLLEKENNNNNTEIFMDGYSMIIDLKVPFNREEINKSLRRLRREKHKKNNTDKRIQLINSLINFLLGQREICSFYKRFGSVN